MGGPRVRVGVRALVVDADDRLLLVRFELGDGELWAAPGGGVEEGESPTAALARELHEEVGLVRPSIGPAVWRRRHLWSFGDFDGQDETFFLVRVRPADLDVPLLTPEQLRAEHVTGMAWWSLADLRTAVTRFAPRRLPTLYAGLVADGPPAEPVDVGV